MDPLASWWVHPVSVRRFLRSGQGGSPVLDTGETVTGFYSDKTQLVAGPDGQQIAASGAFAFPSIVAYIPVRSEITLPATFGNRVVTVQASMVGDGGGQPTPDHQEVATL